MFSTSIYSSVTVKTLQAASLRSGLSCLWESVILSPGLNAGIPRYGQLPHLTSEIISHTCIITVWHLIGYQCRITRLTWTRLRGSRSHRSWWSPSWSAPFHPRAPPLGHRSSLYTPSFCLLHEFLTNSWHNHLKWRRIWTGVLKTWGSNFEN